VTPTEAPNEVVAIGPEPMIVGWALTGVRLCPAQTATEIRTAWQGLPPSTAVVILAPEAAEVLGTSIEATGAPLTVVLPP
jgi:vacuolar-type H+-ATPase subunit F/Vma7